MVCSGCSCLAQCTQSKEHVKVITRHIWEPYMKICEDIRQTLGMKELYSLRKETIERIFGTSKENHGFRYTQMFGKARMEMKVKRGLIEVGSTINKSMYTVFAPKQEKRFWLSTCQRRFVYSLKERDKSPLVCNFFQL